MARVIIFDTTTNRILQDLISASSPDFAGRTDVVISPDLSALAGVPIIYWKQSGGAIVEMTAQEKATVDSDIASAATSTMRTSGKSFLSAIDGDGIILRAIADIVKDEINLLRQRDVDRSADVAAATSLADLKTRWAARSALADRTLIQLRTAINNRIDSGSVDS